MEQKAIINTCKELGCCDACCLRYLGLKNPNAFENPHEFIRKYSDTQGDTVGPTAESPGADADETLPKKARLQSTAACVSCLGVLQEEGRPACLEAVRAALDAKRYECETFACALSAPMATVPRERAVAARLAEVSAGYDGDAVTPLKEAWKWTLGAALARCAGMTLQSGAVAALLVTLHVQYADEEAELRALGGGGRRSLGALGAERLAAAGWARGPPPPARPARAARAHCEHAPLLLGGRYVKLRRGLPQTPWLLRGERLMDSSVQEIICEPLARLYGVDAAGAEAKFKFMSAGREDVDVRCLGTGRPFALEVADPQRTPTAEELARVCEEISSGGEVTVERMVPVTRQQLAELKRGEESKCKTYEALCVKLAHTAEDLAEGAGAGAVRVTARDVRNVLRGAGPLRQRTPLRVLHRRALLARERRVRALAAARVPQRADLLAVRLRTAAGTYVKEWAHGDLGRTRPALQHALGARADIVALDVTRVHLRWP